MNDFHNIINSIGSAIRFLGLGILGGISISEKYSTFIAMGLITLGMCMSIWVHHKNRNAQ